jgi:hypothetical protein
MHTPMTVVFKNTTTPAYIIKVNYGGGSAHHEWHYLFIDDPLGFKSDGKSFRTEIGAFPYRLYDSVSIRDHPIVMYYNEDHKGVVITIHEVNAKYPASIRLDVPASLGVSSRPLILGPIHFSVGY